MCFKLAINFTFFKAFLSIDVANLSEFFEYDQPGFSHYFQFGFWRGNTIHEIDGAFGRGADFSQRLEYLSADFYHVVVSWNLVSVRLF